MTPTQKSEVRGEATEGVAAVGYARPVPRRRLWPKLLFNVVGSTAITYVFGAVILPTDAQAAIGFLLFAPLCVAPTALLSGLAERQVGAVALCAACAALGVGVGVIAHGSWDIIASPADREEATTWLGGITAVAFVPAFLAGLVGLGVGWVSRSRRATRYEPFTCPACGYSLLGLKSPTCPQCSRPFTVEELQAAAGGADEPGRGAVQLRAGQDRRP